LTSGTTETQILNLNAIGCVRFSTANKVVGSIEVEMLEGTFASTVLVVRRSNSGRVNHAMPSAVTIPSAGMTADLSAIGPGEIVVEVTTVAGGTAIANIVAHFKGDA
jgi:hypothetical protein